MSVLHINQIKARLQQDFVPHVVAIDIKAAPEAKEINILSRALAAYAVSKNTKLSPEEACRYITDGFGDNGIDLVYYDIDTQNLWIVQSKFISKNDGGIDNGDIHKFIQGLRDIFDMNYDAFNDKLKAFKTDIETAINEPATKINIVVAYTGKQLSNENKQVLDSYISEVNDPTPLLHLVDFNLEKAHNALKQSLMGTPIDTTLYISNWGMVETPYKAVYGTVQVSAMAQLYNENPYSLFSDNIRFFLGTSDANKGIIKTLRETPEKFLYFNNGITILCDEFQRAVAGGTSRDMGVFKCSGIKIINGAQTVGSIGTLSATENLEDSCASVFVKVISLKDTPENLNEEITIANNTQNKIEKKDFVSLDPEQDRIKMDLLLEGIAYHYKRSSLRVPIDERNFSFEECTQALVTYQKDVSLSVQAKREIGKIWETTTSRPYTDLFNTNLEVTYLIHVVKAFRFVASRLAQKSDATNDGRTKRIYTYGNLFITHMVMRKIDMATMHNKAIDFDNYLQSNTAMIDDVIAKSVKVANEAYANNNVPQLYRNFTKCKDMEQRINEM